jgi:ribonuclease VapC
VIVVDTSALIAILWREPDAEALEDALFRVSRRLLAAPVALEFYMVANGAGSWSDLPDAMLSRLNLTIEPWTGEHLAIARAAFRRFGKGQGHPAQLNYGDCMSYALAKALDVPLLFKGGDFALTDVVPAL